jgi:pimeloyl-ACP methyl ester carboxylesterase
VNDEERGLSLKSTTLRIAAIELELFEAGDGPPLLWLHDGQGFHRHAEFVNLFAARRRLIVPSHPGFGKSSLPDWLDSVDDIAHLYLELLDRLDLDQLDIVGCSIGGWIAAEMATKKPEILRRLVMVSPVGIKVGSSDRLDIPDIFAMPQEEVDKLLFHDPVRMKIDPLVIAEQELTILMRNRETLALLSWEPWMHNPKLKHRLHRIDTPALFVRGSSDGVVSADYLQAYAQRLPQARIAEIREAGHLPHVERPQAFASTVLTFLGERAG